MTPGLGPKGYGALLETLAGAALDIEGFLALPRARGKALWHEADQRLNGNSRSVRAALPALEAIPTASEVAEIGERLAAMDCHWIGAEDPRFPRRLRDELAPPSPVLFWIGELSLLDHSPTVGIIGSSSPSRGGARIARTLGQALGEAGWMIVSGMAKGIDQAGHRGALESGGSTAAFLPQGMLDYRVAPMLREFAHQEQFLILSSWPPTAGWSGSLAVRRDVQIAQAADGLVAVEMSARGGGTRYTVNFARERQRPVWTLQYPRIPRQALGNTWLLRTGAKPIALDARQAVEDESLKALMAQLKKELAQGRKRRRAMQLEMF